MAQEVFKYGCVYLKIKDTSKLSKIKDIIRPTDIDPKDGLEDNYHVTILYGLEPGIDTEEVKNRIKDIDIQEVLITGISLFENDTDVLKLDVFPDFQMLEMRKKLKELPNTDKYPEYKPHLTLGYLKSGAGEKYIPDVNKFEQPAFFEVSDVVYSHGGKNQKDVIHESLIYNKIILNEKKN